MNWPTRVLILLVGLAMVWIGSTGVVTGDHPMPPSWRVLYRVVPFLVWEACFFLVGLLALVGLLWLHLARLAFRLTGALYTIWTAVSLIAYLDGLEATIPGTLNLMLIAAFLFGSSEYILSAERWADRTARLSSKLDEVEQQPNPGVPAGEDNPSDACAG